MSQRTVFFIILLLLGISHSLATAQNLTSQEQQWLNHAYRYEKNGWTFLHIEGEPFERGFQRGYLIADEIEASFKTLAFLTEFETAKKIDFFVNAAARLFADKVSDEFIEEMRGMVSGVKKAGKNISFEQVLFMNGSNDILDNWWQQVRGKTTAAGSGCSAFIATGDATADGKIVMAHNTWTSYAILKFYNLILDLKPAKGNRILMQSWGPMLYSESDFFITGAGLVGTETTIGGFHGFDSTGTPIFERARKAMQYANNIDEWADIMIQNNNGAYANSWLIGDIKTNEIARLELGLKNHPLQKKTSGYFTGSNVANDIRLLREETTATYDDIRDFCVARRVRWNQLMDQYAGKIDVEIAKKMLADHYDVYLEKEQPGWRTICGHWELDDGSVPGTRGAYLPGGTSDGKVVDARMAKKWQIWAKWGSSCDIGFDAGEFLKKHPQYRWQEKVLKDLPAMPWTIFPAKPKK